METRPTEDEVRPGPENRGFLPATTARILDRYGMMIAALVIALAGFCWGERVEVNGGFGWDGVIYGRWAKDFYREIFVKRVDTYYVQRILPAAVVHYSLRALGIARTDRNVLRGFSLLNVALITLMAFWWTKTARHLRLSRGGGWLGFTGLFLNYIILKHTFYCPVTTDVFAYAIGTGMAYFYLRGNTPGLFGLVLAGAFSWPLSVYAGALLLLFPKDPGQDRKEEPPPYRLHLVLAAGLAGVVLLGIKYALRKGPSLTRGLMDPLFLRPMPAVVNLSLAISVLYFFLGVAGLLDDGRLFRPRALLGRLRPGVCLGVAVLVFGVRWLQGHWANGQYFMGLKEMLALTGFATVAKPGVFLVAHVAYYGPILLMVPFLWGPVCRLVHEQGTGLTLALLMGLALSLNSQSRYFINLMPLLIPFLAKAGDSLNWGARQYIFLAGLSVLFSKVWLTTNVGPFHGRLLEFPDQYLFMSHGPWMSDAMYLAQGAVFLLGGVGVYVACFRDRGTGQTPALRINSETRRLAA